ncbi:YegJ family protein [Ramlibacter sp. WS9]|uniref:YegJ family protein n=1 Tax=Ramlibacter sp. WS9 TaxID=1882741 RepID=UPI0011411D7A|nr:DUF2314 domain-containing protein [Ramlibacter sp. WS9]ROZ61469.1 DUF2314 domain-containing protein [Ramlibacter sp. WS9]
MLKLAVCLASFALVSLSMAQTVVDRARADELVFMSDNDPAMRQAFARARATFDEFLSKAKEPAPGTLHYAVKVGIREGEDTEYFWVGDFTQDSSGMFSGRIDNEPRLVKKVKAGQRYTFPKGHIVDWTYVDRNQRRMVGNFTMCALLTKEPQAEAAAARQKFGLRCE